MRGPRWILPLLAASATLAVAGCGGGDEDATDPATMKSNFDEEAQAAYDAGGADRDEDSSSGIVLDGNCFILDQGGADEIAEALGVESVEIAASSVLTGEPGEEEALTCTLVDDQGSGFATVVAGTTQATPKQLRRRNPLILPVKGTAPGLDPADVAAVIVAFSRRYTWVNDGFIVSINGPTKGIDEKAGFEALPVAVDEVARTLASDD